MYRSCIFCSGKLGSNDAIEGFPVGRTVSFDGAKGRLWAVCPTCGRWNLAPIEERWEVVEAAERLFRDSRVRVHAENVGLTKLRDGTRLVRVGSALRGELAAWRFGDEMARRMRLYRLRLRLYGAAHVAPALFPYAVMLLAPGAALLGWLAAPVLQFTVERATRGMARPLRDPVERVVQYTGGVPLRAGELIGAYFSIDGNEPVLNVPRSTGWTELRGREVPEVLARGVVSMNAQGAEREEVDGALDLLTSFPTASSFVDSLVQQRTTLWYGPAHVAAGIQLDPRYWIRRAERAGVPRDDFFRWQIRARDSILSNGYGTGRRTMLALEMALHEERERRALEGELAELEAAWRQAEEIAAIADRLPDLPAPDPPRL